MNYRLNRSFVPWIIAHALEFWYYYIGAIASLYFLHHFQSELPFVAKKLGDLVSEGKLEDISLWTFAWLSISILIFRTLSRLLFFYPARIQQRNLRMELMQRLESANPNAYKKVSEGQMFQTIYNDLNRIRGFIGFALLQIGNIIIAGMIFIPKIRDFNSDLLIAFSPMVICIILFSIMVYFVQPLNVRGMKEAGDVQNFMIECYDAKKTIQNYHSEKAFFDLFSLHSGKELKTFFHYTAARNITFPLLKIGVGASLLWGALIIHDSGSPGTDLIFFSGFLFLILEPLMLVSWIAIVVGQGYAAWQRIKSLLSQAEKKIKSSVEYNEREEAFYFPFWEHKVKLLIHEHKWNIFLGDTGHGKSYLIERYADYLSDQKKSFSFIQQEPYLYNDSIQGNIFLGIVPSPALVQRVKKYLEIFGLEILADNLDDVLDLEIGENGKKVSGGQAKRVALIRSLISDVDYILWDDPFSSVDLILEKQILDVLKEEEFLKNKTFILSSHRLSTVKRCDEFIFVDKNEKTVQSGKVLEGLNKGSFLGEYFEKQMV